MMMVVRADKLAPTEQPGARADGDQDGGEDLNVLARAALAEGPQAMQTFLQAISPLIRRTCRSVMGRAHADLEDTIQDCLIQVARALPQFRFQSDVSHYVVKITLRESIASRRRGATRSRFQYPLDGEVLSAPFLEGSDEVRTAIFRDLVDKVSQDQSDILLLLTVGFSVGEIAALQGVPINTVKSRLRRGRAHLRRWLERRGERRDPRD